MALKIRHVDRYPYPAPTLDQLRQHRAWLQIRHERTGLQYLTGPRRGQQLATAHLLARTEAR